MTHKVLLEGFCFEVSMDTVLILRAVQIAPSQRCSWSFVVLRRLFVGPCSYIPVQNFLKGIFMLAFGTIFNT